MINESAVYHFINKNNQYALTIFNGSHFMNEVANWQNFGPNEIKALRPLILSLQSLLTVIKNNESFGAYVSSEDGDFKFNLESHASGVSRILLKSNGDVPAQLNGLCKFVKFQPNDTAPYTSVIEMKDNKYSEIATKIIERSYQFDASIEIFEENNLSILLTKFPHVEEGLKDIAPTKDIYKNVVQAFAKEQDEESLINEIAGSDFTFLSLKRVQLKCRCSKEKVVMTFRSLANQSIEELFEKDNAIDVNCDYCGVEYKLSKDDLSVH